MNYQYKALTSLTANDISFIVSLLKKDKVLVLPTDTIYGLSCRASSYKAFTKIRRLKNRPDYKPFILLISDLEMANQLADIKPEKLKEIKKIWQTSEPTTIILKGQKSVLPFLKSKAGNISLRLPKSDFLIKIIKELGEPLISTSLNLSGQPALKTVKELDMIFPANLLPDFVFDSGVLDRPPSKIIDYSGNKPFQVR
ncbi:MAG: L-threonylcarbamoyladenylate synthase [Patescibacteria group bacterium]|nr:L-threonylcarbamoyladenylate synthase [Patescibacteria group bacterium]